MQTCTCVHSDVSTRNLASVSVVVSKVYAAATSFVASHHLLSLQAILAMN